MDPKEIFADEKASYFLIKLGQTGCVDVKSGIWDHYKESPSRENMREVKEGDFLLGYYARRAPVPEDKRSTLFGAYRVLEKITPYKARIEQVFMMERPIPYSDFDSLGLSKIKDGVGWQGGNTIRMPRSEFEAAIKGEKVCGMECKYLPVPSERLKTGIGRICGDGGELFLDKEAVYKVVDNLRMGKNVILTGVPGTGKTHLAKLLVEQVFPEYTDNGKPVVVTATNEWTTYDVIGGIFPFPKEDGGIEYKFKEGYVLSCQSGGRGGGCRWLLIDEFNRANIDRAFGDLFTALEYYELEVLTERGPEKRSISPDFRIIGTLNTFDKHFLFEMSDALKRRFAFVHIDVPRWQDESREMEAVKRRAKEIFRGEDEAVVNELLSGEDFDAALKDLFTFVQFLRRIREIGTAQLITCCRYVMAKYVTKRGELREPLRNFLEGAIDEAVESNIVPQLDGLSESELKIINAFLSATGGDEASVQELVSAFFDTAENDKIMLKANLKGLTSKIASYWAERFGKSELPGLFGVADTKPVPQENKEKIVRILRGEALPEHSPAEPAESQ